MRVGISDPAVYTVAIAVPESRRRPSPADHYCVVVQPFLGVLDAAAAAIDRQTGFKAQGFFQPRHRPLPIVVAQTVEEIGRSGGSSHRIRADAPEAPFGVAQRELPRAVAGVLESDNGVGARGAGA